MFSGNDQVTQYGQSGDIPFALDFDGDRRPDKAVWRPSTGYWYILQSSTSYATYLAQQWGLSTDITVVGDYDGDGKTDLAVFRNTTWYVLESHSTYKTQWHVV